MKSPSDGKVDQAVDVTMMVKPERVGRADDEIVDTMDLTVKPDVLFSRRLYNTIGASEPVGGILREQ